MSQEDNMMFVHFHRSNIFFFFNLTRFTEGIIAPIRRRFGNLKNVPNKEQQIQ